MKFIQLSGSYLRMEIYDEIIEFIKNNCNHRIISFVATSFDNYDDNDYHQKKLLTLFKEKDFVFNRINLIDNRLTNDEMIEKLEESDIILLMGGDTLKQMYWINKFNLKKYICSENKVILGISAGAINMAKNVVLAKDEDDNIPDLSMYEGLGISDINIEPHCNFKDKNHIEEIKNASLYSDIVVMNDDAFIIGDNDNIKYYGGYFIMKKGKIFYKDVETDIKDFMKAIHFY